MSIPSSRFPDPVTRTTRLAANGAAVAVVVWGVLFVVTTQLKAIRAGSPFADDPWDAVTSFAAIGLVVVVAATGVRSLRHREPTLPSAIAARIRLGAGIALGIIAVNVLSDAVAIAVVVLPAPADVADGRLGLNISLVGLTAVATALSVGLLWHAYRVDGLSASGPMDAASSISTEPDILDDALSLTVDVLAHVPVVAGPGRRLVGLMATVLEEAPMSPRRHRVAFGLVASLAAGVGFAVWHALREGAWVSPLVAVLFTSLIAVTVLVAYLATLRPLRLIRPI